MYYYIPEGVFCYKKGKEYKKYKEQPFYVVVTEDGKIK